MERQHDLSRFGIQFKTLLHLIIFTSVFAKFYQIKHQNEWITKPMRTFIYPFSVKEYFKNYFRTVVFPENGSFRNTHIAPEERDRQREWEREREREREKLREIAPIEYELEAFSNAHLFDAIPLYMRDNKKLLLFYAPLLRKRKNGASDEASKAQRQSNRQHKRWGGIGYAKRYKFYEIGSPENILVNKKP